MRIPSQMASYAVIEEPFLEFGTASKTDEQPFTQDPQIGLLQHGPYSLQLGQPWHPPSTTLVPICADEDFDAVINALERMETFERVDDPNWYVRVDFPGYEAAYHSKLEIVQDCNGQIIPRTVWDAALGERTPREGFRILIDALTASLTAVADSHPNATAVVFLPRDIVTQFRTLTSDFQLAKPRKPKATTTSDARQILLFEDLFDTDDDTETLYNDLRRAIKVRAMQKGLPLQILTDSFLNEEPSQPWAGKFWNVSCSLFCKAGGIPWRLPTAENIAHCGIRFGVSKDESGTKILVGVAQVFSASGELVAVRTGPASKAPKRTSEAGYFLTEEQAFELVSNAIVDYESVLGRLPDRMLIHKSSSFKDVELKGINAAKGGVREIDLVYIKGKTPLRIMPQGGQPAARGTIVPTSDDSALLYLSGFISSETSWRGKHIPSPVELVRFQSNRSLLDLSEEVLRLTKMNWNTTVFASRHPCTFSNATEMIGMMKELRKAETLAPQIKYYI